jgi:hypothetical protein
MPYITFDPETGRGLMHVDLAGVLAGEQFKRVLAAVRDSSLASEADEPRVPVSLTLDDAMAWAMDQVLAREGDTHAQWRLLNEPWKP